MKSIKYKNCIWLKDLKRNNIPLGMYRSVERVSGLSNPASSRDASLTGCKKEAS